MAAKGEKTREYILNESYILFAKKGFKQVTMKDVCEVTNMSRGGLYSHFSSTGELFEALLEVITQNDEMDFRDRIKKGTPAAVILDDALKRMEHELINDGDSLNTAMYEYAQTVDSGFFERLHKNSEKKWKELIKYGIKNGEFNDVDVDEIVNMILFSYQGVRMWNGIITIKTKTCRSIIRSRKRQLTGE